MTRRTKPRLLVLAPEALFQSFFDRGRQRRLGRSFRWRLHPDRTVTPRLRAALAKADALVTTWDSPRLDEGLLELAPRLRLIGHCGGEVKGRRAPSFRGHAGVLARGPEVVAPPRPGRGLDRRDPGPRRRKGARPSPGRGHRRQRGPRRPAGPARAHARGPLRPPALRPRRDRS